MNSASNFIGSTSFPGNNVVNSAYKSAYKFDIYTAGHSQFTVTFSNLLLISLRLSTSMIESNFIHT